MIVLFVFDVLSRIYAACRKFSDDAEVEICMMLAVTTTDTLTVADPVIIKRAPSIIAADLQLTTRTTASVWLPDNTALFLASAKTIHRYDLSSDSIKDIYTSVAEDSISNLVSKDKATLIFSAGDKVHTLECGGSPPKLSQTFDSHKWHITSISLSNDSTLLASTSGNAAHVHNLSLGSHTVLRGLTALAGQSGITTCAFHPHSRTRLLLSIGKQLVIYDTTRPSGPMKTIAMNESTSGDINAIACSPFSKTLVAVATTGGNVGLVDLDKEKGCVYGRFSAVWDVSHLSVT